MSIRTRTSGIMVSVNVEPTTVVAAYQGPGDVIPGAKAWWGLRAYSAATATAGSTAIKLMRSSDNSFGFITLLANGNLDTSNTFFNGSSAYYTQVIYDQTGNGFHLNNQDGGSTTTPLFTLNGLSGKPSLTFSGNPGSNQRITTTSSTLSARAQPFSWSTVANTSNDGTTQVVISDNVDVIFTYFQRTGANVVTAIAATANLDATESDGSWHTFQSIYNGSSSHLYVDGTDNTGNTGTGTVSSGAEFELGGAGSADFNGGWVEWGYWESNISGASATALSSNQRIFWGL